MHTCLLCEERNSERERKGDRERIIGKCVSFVHTIDVYYIDGCGKTFFSFLNGKENTGDNLFL